MPSKLKAGSGSFERGDIQFASRGWKASAGLRSLSSGRLLRVGCDSVDAILVDAIRWMQFVVKSHGEIDPHVIFLPCECNQ